MAVRGGQAPERSESGRIRPQPGAVKKELVNSVGDTAVSAEQLQVAQETACTVLFMLHRMNHCPG